MQNNVVRGEKYIARLKKFIAHCYGVNVLKLVPVRRGYYGETWKLCSDSGVYFVKLDYFARHREKFRRSLSVVDYLCQNGILFVGRIVKTRSQQLYCCFDGAIMAMFIWIDGKNVETDETKISEYRMLAEIYTLTKPGLDIPTVQFSADAACSFYENWQQLQNSLQTDADRAILCTLKRREKMISHCASRLCRFAVLCQEGSGTLYFTHGDAGGNFFIGKERNYILDWDEVAYASPERDAWVMCCRAWAKNLFEDTLKQYNICYRLRPERLAFYCYHMFFFYLGEMLADRLVRDMSGEIENYFDGWIRERILFADGIDETKFAAQK